MRPPPKWVRRLVIAPLVVALGLVALAVTPIALILFLAVISLVPHVRTLRVVWLAFVYLVWDARRLDNIAMVEYFRRRAVIAAAVVGVGTPRIDAQPYSRYLKDKLGVLAAA